MANSSDATSILSDVTPLKRTFDSSFPNQDVSKTKVLKTDRLAENLIIYNQTDSTLLNLALELQNNIYSNFDYLSLHYYEMTCKTCKQSTKHVWKEIKIRDGYNFSWKITQKESNPDKSDYCISDLLYHHGINQHLFQQSELPSEEKPIAKFDKMNARFPILQTFLNFDSKKFEYPIEDTIQEDFSQAILENWPGELLLQSLVESKTYLFQNSDSPHQIDLGELHQISLDEVVHSYKVAIINGATCASLFAIKLFDEEFKTMNWILAVEAFNQNDKRAVLKLLKKYAHDPLFDAIKEMKEQEQWEDADKLYTLLLNYYIDPDASLLAEMAYVKFNLENWQDADSFYTLALDDGRFDNDQDFLYALNEAAFVKVELDLYKDAVELYNLCIACYVQIGQTPLDNVKKEAELAKGNLKKCIDTDRALTQTISSFGQNVSAPLLIEAALTKVKLCQWNEAIILFNRAIDKGYELSTTELQMAMLAKKNADNEKKRWILTPQQGKKEEPRENN